MIWKVQAVTTELWLGASKLIEGKHGGGELESKRSGEEAKEGGRRLILQLGRGCKCGMHRWKLDTNRKKKPTNGLNTQKTN